MDNESYEIIETDQFIPAEADYAVHITGDSMQPMFQDQQIIYVHHQDNLEDGEIGIFVLDGQVFCKKFMNNKKGTALISLNKKYNPIPVQEFNSFNILGKVLV